MQQKQCGVGNVRERALLLARGVYVQFLDSDDYLDWDEEQRLIDLIQDAPDTLNILTFGCIGETFEGEFLYSYVPAATLYEPTISKRSALQVPPLWSNVFRRSFLLEQALPFPNQPRAEDIAQMLPLLYNTMATMPSSIAATSIMPHHYVFRPTSVTRSSDPYHGLNMIDVFEEIHRRIKPEAYQKFHAEIEYAAIIHLRCISVRSAILNDGANSTAIGMLEQYMHVKFPRWKRNPYLQDSRYPLTLGRRLLLRRHFHVFAALFTIKDALQRRIRQ